MAAIALACYPGNSNNSQLVTLLHPQVGSFQPALIICKSICTPRKTERNPVIRSETVKSWVPRIIMTYMKKLRFSSHLLVKI